MAPRAQERVGSCNGGGSVGQPSDHEVGSGHVPGTPEAPASPESPASPPTTPASPELPCPPEPATEELPPLPACPAAPTSMAGGPSAFAPGSQPETTSSVPSTQLLDRERCRLITLDPALFACRSRFIREDTLESRVVVDRESKREHTLRWIVPYNRLERTVGSEPRPEARRLATRKLLARDRGGRIGVARSVANSPNISWSHADFETISYHGRRELERHGMGAAHQALWIVSAGEHAVEEREAQKQLSKPLLHVGTHGCGKGKCSRNLPWWSSNVRTKKLPSSLVPPRMSAITLLFGATNVAVN